MAFQDGDVARVSKVASVRKSILAMLYGKYVANGTIDLDANRQATRPGAMEACVSDHVWNIDEIVVLLK